MGYTYAVTMVKNEADVIAGTIRHMAGEVDHVIVSDNGSTDGTRDILADLAHGLGITVLDDPDPAYYQSRKMTELANRAACMGAEWIVPFDADELWYSRAGRIADVLAATPADLPIANAELFNHFPTAIDPDTGCPFTSIVWRGREPGRLPKVACRWRPGAVIHQGNHGVTLPGDGFSATILEVRHFQYRTAEQFVNKAMQGAAAYAAAPDLPADMGAHWRAYGEIARRHGVEALAEVFRAHFWHLSPTDAGLVLDPAPFRGGVSGT